MIRIAAAILCLLPLQGCYYMQAAAGQWEVVSKREPLQQVIDATDTDAELARRLRLVQRAREFSITVLMLPDNGSYRTFTQLDRDYVVWNVFATPEFSLRPRTWCFPVAGCVNYRGYFDRQKALRHAQKLASDGLDVAVHGVAAYSTLGRFDDPILSTMLQWDDVRLVGVLFHELAHQVLYVKDDTAFNESFASAVEEIGLQRWLAAEGDADSIGKYRAGQETRLAVVERVDTARADLQALYDSDLDSATMRLRKRQRLALLGDEVADVLRSRGEPFAHWQDGKLNNARLVPIALYAVWLPVFRELYSSCQDDLACFYAASRALADLPAERREQRLRQLAAAVQIYRDAN